MLHVGTVQHASKPDVVNRFQSLTSYPANESKHANSNISARSSCWMQLPCEHTPISRITPDCDEAKSRLGVEIELAAEAAGPTQQGHSQPPYFNSSQMQLRTVALPVRPRSAPAGESTSFANTSSSLMTTSHLDAAPAASLGLAPAHASNRQSVSVGNSPTLETQVLAPSSQCSRGFRRDHSTVFAAAVIQSAVG